MCFLLVSCGKKLSPAPPIPVAFGRAFADETDLNHYLGELKTEFQIIENINGNNIISAIAKELQRTENYGVEYAESLYSRCILPLTPGHNIKVVAFNKAIMFGFVEADGYFYKRKIFATSKTLRELILRLELQEEDIEEYK